MSDFKLKICSPPESKDLVYEYSMSDKFMRAYDGYRVYKKNNDTFIVNKIGGNLIDNPFRVLVSRTATSADRTRLTLKIDQSRASVKFISIEEKQQYIKNALVALKLMCTYMDSFLNKKENGLI